jgi:hypothetical protein
MYTRSLLWGFRSWDTSHIRLEGNIVAHILAKFTFSFEQTKMWFESHPICLLGLINSELFFVSILMKLQDPFKEKKKKDMHNMKKKCRTISN